jgi:hypothetical protein
VCALALWPDHRGVTLPSHHGRLRQGALHRG